MEMIFSGLPLPHYISSGVSYSEPGRKHPDRRAIGEFDLLVVKRGGLFIAEEERSYEVEEGQALILRPDLHHYPTAGCKEATESFWLHFHTLGFWRLAEEPASVGEQTLRDKEPRFGEPRTPAISIVLPQYVRLIQPGKGYDLLQQLVSLEKNAHVEGIRYRQQMLFQELLLLLNASREAKPPQPGVEVADRAASYLREHYKEPITAHDLSRELNFHPVYIARCMNRQFGVPPMVYLLHYRLEQARLLLLQTDLPIHLIAEESGFRQAAYFTACFRRWGGLTPREYRQLFAVQNEEHASK